MKTPRINRFKALIATFMSFITVGLCISAFFMTLPSHADAHVRYLVDDTEFAHDAGIDTPYLLTPFAQKPYVLLMLGTVLVVILVSLLVYHIPVLRKELGTIRERADSYYPLIPWMLRLSLGIGLIGSGVSNFVISPVLHGFGYLSFFQILLGFFLLAGFLVVPVATAALALFVFGIVHDWYLVGNLEFAAAALALLMLDNERPGIDDVINLPQLSPLNTFKHYAPLVLRIGIGGAMMFLAVYEKFLNPHVSAFVVENFGLLHVVPVSTEMWVLGAGIIEFLIGFALIIGIRVRLVSAIAFIVLSLSFFYFEEDVASHITLFGVLSVLFVTRGGVLSLDNYLAKKLPPLTS